MKKTLKDILSGVTILSVNGSMEIKIDTIVFDSRKAAEDTVFIAIKGSSCFFNG